MNRATASRIVILVSLFFAISFKFVYGQSAGIEDLIDVIDDTNLAATDVSHQIGFTLPISGLAIDPNDYININFPYFTDVTAATYITGQYSGTPVFSVAGTRVQITGIVVFPGNSITIGGITATNPAFVGQNFQVIVSVSEDAAGSIITKYGTTTASDGVGTVSVTADVENPRATIRITGYAGPYTFVSFTQGENVIGTDLSSMVGVYNKIFPALEPGVHEISLYGVDEDNRATSIVPLSINAPVYQTTTVSNILLSPTLEISDNTLLQGQDLYATGSAYPGTDITIFTDTPMRTYTANTSAAGVWTTTITDTEDYTPGDYRIYTLAQSGGLQSLASHKLVFSISTSGAGGGGAACGDISGGDLDCDGDVDLTDFSILMYYWAQENATADVNSDTFVDLIDFSIMMYFWG